MEKGIKEWLRRKRTLEAPACLLGSVGSMDIEGVIFLEGGVTLTSDLRSELIQTSHAPA